MRSGARGRLLGHSAADPSPIHRDTRPQIVWRCVEEPNDWPDTRITVALTPRHDGGTTLLSAHEGWQEENKFMNGCSTN
jgi:hypothetical protein